MRDKPNQTPQQANFRQAYVLIIEDNDDQWQLIQHAMQHQLAGVGAVRVITHEQALTQLHQWQYQDWALPKLIFLDLYLPRCSDGLQLLTAIKNLPAPINHVPILMLSYSQDRSDILKSYELGAASYLIKPTKAADWLVFFQNLKAFWWETATLPRSGFSF